MTLSLFPIKDDRPMTSTARRVRNIVEEEATQNDEPIASYNLIEGNEFGLPNIQGRIFKKLQRRS